MSSSRSVVIADDDRFIVDSLESYLKGTEYVVAGTCANGLDLVKMCEEKKPDIVIADIEMPVMDGIEATKKLVEENLAKCVIVLTSFDDEKYVHGAIDSGAAGYLTKPLSKDVLVPTIAAAFRQSVELYDASKKVSNINKRLETREIIEKAKLTLMEKESLSEEDAYRMIKEMSKERKRSMAEISEIILAKYGDR